MKPRQRGRDGITDPHLTAVQEQIEGDISPHGARTDNRDDLGKFRGF